MLKGNMLKKFDCSVIEDSLLPDNIKRIMKATLAFDPEERPSTTEIIKVL